MKTHLCLISDDNYVMPTCTAIKSIIASKGDASEYVIHIIASALKSESKSEFLRLATDSVEIDVIEKDPSVFEGLHTFAEGAVCVASVSALFKFLLPDILPKLDKVLYLDGDLICKADLTELYNTDLGNNYAAAVPDSGQIYYKHAYVRRVTKYINSGVMLLNLKKMRADNLSEVLVRTKKELTDSNLMDQNVFNVVFDHHLIYLPVRYNFMPVSLWRAKEKWKISDINSLFVTQYKTVRDLFADAAIVHYSSKDKPWKASDGAMAYLWHEYGTPTPSAVEGKPLVSIIIPTYNVEAYVEEMLDSLLTQTFTNFEIICLDDGSSDKTPDIIEAYCRKDPRIKLVRNDNHRQAYERNRGIEMAVGKYIYFMDSDDILEVDCLSTIVGRAERENLDLLFFEATSFYESEELEKIFPAFRNLYHRKGVYPGVWNGKSLYVELRKGGDAIVSPCLQLVRRSVLIDNDIRFPELTCHEDNLYLPRVLLASSRVSCYPDVLYRRRVRASSTMTRRSERRDMEAYGEILKGLVFLAMDTKDDSVCKEYLLYHADRFYTYMQKQAGFDKSTIEVQKERIAALTRQVNDLTGKVKYRGRKLDEVNARIEVMDRKVAELDRVCKVVQKDRSDAAAKIKIAEQKERQQGRRLKASVNEVTRLKHSEAYRVGMFVTWPARRAYHMFKCWRENGLKYTLRRLILCKGHGRK